jgi:hypothetical protein
MLRVLITLFWISLLIGTLAAHSVVANWAVTLAGLYFAARWWAGRRQGSSTASVPSPATRPPAAGAYSYQHDATAGSSGVDQDRSRWTVDRVHAAERVWR